jgi:hypothetical protein
MNIEVMSHDDLRLLSENVVHRWSAVCLCDLILRDDLLIVGTNIRNILC